MDTKLLLYINNENDFSLIEKYDGAYVELKSLPPVDLKGKELFISAVNLTPAECYALALTAPKNSTFVCDDAMKAAFIKSALPSAKISFYTEKFDSNLIPYIVANGFDITVKYTALAPERILAFQSVNAKVNGAIVKRLDEVGVLKYWNVDYVTVTKDAY